MNKIKQIPYIKYLPIIIFSIILYKVINNLEQITYLFSYLISILSYLIWGFIIAYFLNFLINFITKSFKCKRIISIIITYLIFLIFLIFSISILIPIVIKNITHLSQNVPEFVNTISKLIENNISKNNELIEKYNILGLIEENKENIITQTTEYLNIVFLKAIDITAVLIKFVLGILISFYMLKDKNKLKLNAKKLLYAFLQEENARKFIYLADELHILFSKFILGRLIVSFIVGIICFIVSIILDIPFAPLISLIVGVTNILPYIGPIVGGAISCIIILFADPIKALWALIFFILLQTFDGFFLGPKIVGDQVNVSPLLIMIALIVGGGFFGITGMFLAVPLFALFERLIKVYINKRLKSKNIKI